MRIDCVIFAIPGIVKGEACVNDALIGELVERLGLGFDSCL